jgi:hypothetical protein
MSTESDAAPSVGFEPDHEIGEVDIECSSDLEQIQQGDVSSATFDRSEIRPVYRRTFGEFLLRQAEILASVSNSGSKFHRCRECRRSAGHVIESRVSMTMRLETMRPILGARI